MTAGRAAAVRMPEGDTSCRETVQERRAPAGFFSLACFHGIPTGQLPRDCPRETDFAAERPEGDGFRPVSVAFGLSHGTRRSASAARPLARKRPASKGGPSPQNYVAYSSLQAQRVDGARRNARAALDALVLVDLSVIVDGQSAYRAGICASAARDAGILVNLYCHESSLLYTAPKGAAFSVAKELLALYRPALELVTDNIPKAQETPLSGRPIIWPAGA